MAISASDVKKLRDATGVGMMDCKKALKESDGDFDKAVELLRKKGQKVAAKRADKEAKEGLIVTAISDDGRTGAIAEVNCETDFVARNADFSDFANRIGKRILEERPADLEALEALTYDGDQTIEAAVHQMTGKIGEKIEIRRFTVLESSAGQVVSYVHPGSRLGVLVELSGNGKADDAGVDVAMQVAALDPIATNRDEVPEEVQNKEREIARDAALNEGKPDHIVDRIVDGKLERFFKDHVLIEQPFVKDSSITVQERLEQDDVGVERFVRYALGE